MSASFLKCANDTVVDDRDWRLVRALRVVHYNGRKKEFNYRVFHQLADLGWVVFDLGSSAVWLILLRQMAFGQKWLSTHAR